MVAPRTVEVSLWSQPVPGKPGSTRLIVHLANRTAAWSLPTDERQITEVIELRDVRVSLAAPRAGAKVSARKSRESHGIEGDRLVVTLDRVGPYAAVVVEEGAVEEGGR